MIRPEDRFWVCSESVTGDLHAGTVIDWDQRRWYTINGSIKFIPPEEDKDIDVLKRYIDHLAPSVYSITVDDDGLLTSVSSAPEDDPLLTIHYPRYAKSPSLQSCSTIEISRLAELDRLGPGVDLVSYSDSDKPEAQRKVVFKYSMIFQRRTKIWHELHITKSLPAHPNLVPFDRVVVDDVESRVLGFTTAYVPGGCLDDNKSRIFRLEYFQQLTSVVDYLNLELGIIHQDVAARNILLDSKTQNILLFDFDRAAPVGHPWCVPQRNDVAGVIFTLYEIITQDEHYRHVPFQEQNPESVQSLEEWPVKCKLDNDVALFRKHLNEWVQRRKAICDVAPFVPEPKPFDIPTIPPPSPVITGHGEDGAPIVERGRIMRTRRSLRDRNQNIISWERPPQQPTCPLPNGTKRKRSCSSSLEAQDDRHLSLSTPENTQDRTCGNGIKAP
ncbi:hypothetical protein L228DRAFT_251216 [Xylona heveae TC161]|uniref:EKC/KEOPS complex subunit BUD32 n=1 Tax=Xylona heveae (strain CBS 132557 / TC161) TaxID=1328760 RepID=A0A164ZI67_XYLHT|nr:hypothetical protein L228DRAFT_251216 [Xylona heveae TC161]KZF19127.1 hypothetical protein L228DRAFT_251216 [Xylona heveae TC161]